MQGHYSLGCMSDWRYKRRMTNLLEIPLNAAFRIIQIQEKTRKKLLQYGLHVGDVVRVAPLGGPLLVEINSREIAIGREIAKKIIVEAE